MIYVANAVPEGSTGTLNLVRQGLDMRVENLPIKIQGIDGKASGLANIRTVDGLEEIDITLRGLAAGQKFDVCASNGKTSNKIMTVKANPGGAVPEALAFASFFDNYDRVMLVPTGQQPR
ncbi:hypothetical protein [Marinobacter gelidimuriae]|uniref:hypothetical protein n=1 Tax=Marinobacter gelidimuriae TaxID=2739064 RepID=UPI00037E58EE|nr:hypothetical protein [Marinobacter gelidimuriae]